jgi:hypothetical protein
MPQLRRNRTAPSDTACSRIAPEGIELDGERFWFRAEAMEYIGRARRMADLVSRAGLPIVERRTREVSGYVRWQDAHQLAAKTYQPADGD